MILLGIFYSLVVKTGKTGHLGEFLAKEINAVRNDRKIYAVKPQAFGSDFENYSRKQSHQMQVLVSNFNYISDLNNRLAWDSGHKY
jgi:hypothetical protein